MLSVASSLFGKSSTLSAYTLHSAGPSPSASSTNLAGSGRSSPAGRGKSFSVGLWKVVGATHKTTNKDVSVWVFEKRVLDGVRSGRDWVVEQLKKDATALSRLRHPDILHMVEPLEDTRTELTFVTELVTGSLASILAAAKSGKGRGDSGEVDLDEVEIQKGTLQIARGLSFLHQQAKSVHLNLSPDAVLVNAKGDWKLSGLSLTTPLQQPDGTATKAVFVEVDTRLPPQVQWKMDYLAPEYAMDSQLLPANDLYSLGCVLYAVHMGGRPPFSNRSSLQSLRENADGPLGRREYARGQNWERCSNELKDLLPRLLTRHAGGRISLQSLTSHPFFSSLAISTLNFLDPTTFASKPREEKATFLRGLVRVLPNFSERLKKGKILLSLLEEMKDPYLLPFLLPNVFEISKSLNKDEFAIVLPKLQPLFALKDPPQNMLTLLENMSLFEEKTSPALFREHVMPLIYNSLDSEHVPVQERVLKSVPHLCEILDYGTVQNVLLTKIAILFTRTRILSIKVQTLECFTAMVSTLDQSTLTTKMVPLLAKIKTKEPAVMMATLSVHEAMGAKVGLESIATLVLPQLWAMSMGPLLNADQFARFMATIKSLSARVEKEHSQHLREVRKMEEQTGAFANGSQANPFDFNSPTREVDFEALVKGGSGVPQPAASTSTSIDPWDVDTWDTPDVTSSLSAFPGLSVSSTPAVSAPSSPPKRQAPRMTSNTSFSSLSQTPSQPLRPAQPSAPGGANYNVSLQPQKPTSPPGYGGFSGSLQPSMSATSPPMSPSFGGMGAGSPMPSFAPPPSRPAAAPAQPAYRPPAPPSQPAYQPPAAAAVPSRPPPGWSSGTLQPTTAPKPAWNASTAAKTDWGDFDPLK